MRFDVVRKLRQVRDLCWDFNFLSVDRILKYPLFFFERDAEEMEPGVLVADAGDLAP